MAGQTAAFQSSLRQPAVGVLTMYSIVTIQISAGFYFQDRLGLTTAETGPLLAIALTLVGVALFVTQVMQVRPYLNSVFCKAEGCQWHSATL